MNEDSTANPAETVQDRPFVFLDELPHYARSMVEEAMEERHAVEAVDDAMDDLIAAVAAYPHYWNWGDGFGGAFMERLREKAEAAGFSTKPKRPPLTAAERERGKMTPGRKRKVMERDEYRCVRCGTHVDLCVDHVIALANGGTSDDANLQTLCRPCNAAKGTK